MLLAGAVTHTTLQPPSVPAAGSMTMPVGGGATATTATAPFTTAATTASVVQPTANVTPLLFQPAADRTPPVVHGATNRTTAAQRTSPVFHVGANRTPRRVLHSAADITAANSTSPVFHGAAHSTPLVLQPAANMTTAVLQSADNTPVFHVAANRSRRVLQPAANRTTGVPQSAANTPMFHLASNGTTPVVQPRPADGLFVHQPKATPVINGSNAFPVAMRTRARGADSVSQAPTPDGRPSAWVLNRLQQAAPASGVLGTPSAPVGQTSGGLLAQLTVPSASAKLRAATGNRTIPVGRQGHTRAPGRLNMQHPTAPAAAANGSNALALEMSTPVGADSRALVVYANPNPVTTQPQSPAVDVSSRALVPYANQQSPAVDLSSRALVPYANQQSPVTAEPERRFTLRSNREVGWMRGVDVPQPPTTDGSPSTWVLNSLQQGAPFGLDSQTPGQFAAPSASGAASGLLGSMHAPSEAGSTPTWTLNSILGFSRSSPSATDVPSTNTSTMATATDVPSPRRLAGQSPSAAAPSTPTWTLNSILGFSRSSPSATDVPSPTSSTMATATNVASPTTSTMATATTTAAATAVLTALQSAVPTTTTITTAAATAAGTAAAATAAGTAAAATAAGTAAAATATGTAAAATAAGTAAAATAAGTATFTPAAAVTAAAAAGSLSVTAVALAALLGVGVVTAIAAARYIHKHKHVSSTEAAAQVGAAAQVLSATQDTQERPKVLTTPTSRALSVRDRIASFASSLWSGSGSSRPAVQTRAVPVTSLREKVRDMFNEGTSVFTRLVTRSQSAASPAVEVSTAQDRQPDTQARVQEEAAPVPASTDQAGQAVQTAPVAGSTDQAAQAASGTSVPQTEKSATVDRLHRLHEQNAARVVRGDADGAQSAADAALGAQAAAEAAASTAADAQVAAEAQAAADAQAAAQAAADQLQQTITALRDSLRTTVQEATRQVEAMEALHGRTTQNVLNAMATVTSATDEINQARALHPTLVKRAKIRKTVERCRAASDDIARQLSEARQARDTLVGLQNRLQDGQTVRAKAVTAGQQQAQVMAHRVQQAQRTVDELVHSIGECLHAADEQVQYALWEAKQHLLQVARDTNSHVQALLEEATKVLSVSFDDPLPKARTFATQILSVFPEFAAQIEADARELAARLEALNQKVDHANQLSTERAAHLNLSPTLLQAADALTEAQNAGTQVEEFLPTVSEQVSEIEGRMKTLAAQAEQANKPAQVILEAFGKLREARERAVESVQQALQEPQAYIVRRWAQEAAGHARQAADLEQVIKSTAEQILAHRLDDSLLAEAQSLVQEAKQAVQGAWQRAKESARAERVAAGEKYRAMDGDAGGEGASGESAEGASGESAEGASGESAEGASGEASRESTGGAAEGTSTEPSKGAAEGGSGEPTGEAEPLASPPVAAGFVPGFVPEANDDNAYLNMLAAKLLKERAESTERVIAYNARLQQDEAEYRARLANLVRLSRASTETMCVLALLPAMRYEFYRVLFLVACGQTQGRQGRFDRLNKNIDDLRTLIQSRADARHDDATSALEDLEVMQMVCLRQQEMFQVEEPSPASDVETASLTQRRVRPTTTVEQLMNRHRQLPCIAAVVYDFVKDEVDELTQVFRQAHLASRAPDEIVPASIMASFRWKTGAADKQRLGQLCTQRHKDPALSALLGLLCLMPPEVVSQ